MIGIHGNSGTGSASGARTGDLPPSVTLLAENLDAILAAGEDLLAMEFDLTGLSHPGVSTEAPVASTSLAAFITRVRIFEGVLLLRLSRAREAANRLLGEDKRFSSVARLFLAGSTELDRALAAAEGECARRWESAHCPLAFMRSRGLVGPECGAFTGLLRLRLDDGYLVAGVIQLGAIMDQAATFLDVLDRHYILFPELTGSGTSDQVHGLISQQP